MERSISQIRYDINHRRSNFRKSNESAPTGYKFLTNHNVENDTQLLKNTQWYIDNGFWYYQLLIICMMKLSIIMWQYMKK